MNPQCALLAILETEPPSCLGSGDQVAELQRGRGGSAVGRGWVERERGQRQRGIQKEHEKEKEREMKHQEIQR